MVGVLAVSAPLEEYAAQTCKRPRKDEDPQNKTITNYFSPLSKDKGLASPKSSSIADYFIRTPPAASRERTPKTTSPRGKSKDAPSTPPTPSSKPSGRGVKQGKRTRLLKRLGDTVPPSDPAASNGGRNHAPSGIMGSDTAALLAEICSHTADLGGDDDDEEDVVFQSETFITTTPPRGQTLKQRTSAEVGQQVNAEITSRGSSDQQPPLVSSVSSEDKTPLGDSSLEGQVDTISFEDFMRNQGTKQESTSPRDSSDVTSAAEDDQEAGQMSSPKTVTIQAQVHLSPPSQPHTSTKIASIFMKSKTENKTTETMATECDKMGPVVSKRKSNVVIQEEDLELAVIDVEAGEATKPKSTPAERQQFMKAFQQVGEAPRTKKNSTKKKDLKEGTEDHHKLEADEQQPQEKAAEETDKAFKIKRTKLLSVDMPKSSKQEKDEETNKASKPKRKTQLPSVDTPKSSKPEERAKETDKASKLKRKTQLPSVDTPKSSKQEKAKETDKASKLKRKTQLPSVDTPKSSKPEEKAKETDKASKPKRKTQLPSVDTPKSSKPEEKAKETDKASKLKRKTQLPSVDTPKSSKPEERAKETDKASKLKRKKIKQSVETQKSSKLAEGLPPDKAAEDTDKGPKLKRTTQLPSVEAEQQPTPPHGNPVLRRSLRRTRSSPSRSPPRMASDSPVLMSTPKVKTPCRKNDVYRAEVLTEVSDVESPIRMRFTRVMRNTRRRLEDEASTPGGIKSQVSQSAKKLSKARKLVEKAKALERRVTRQRSHGTQDLLVIADASISQKNKQKTTTLRSLNDVLGKKAKAKGLVHSGHKEVKKVNKGGVITIDDSPEVSENSQDEEFKSRREFLMSGLPDSLRRQITKTSAIMEAYTASAASFNTVLHVQQRDGCPMWSLVMPRCRLLTDLSPLCAHVLDISGLALSLGDFTHVTPGSSVQPFPAAVPMRRVFSAVLQDLLLDEIRQNNPHFPVRRFFKQFLNKQSDRVSLQDVTKSDTQAEQCLDAAAAEVSSVQETASGGAKRKRKDSPHTKSKRRKAADEEPHCDTAPNPQLSRSSRRKSSAPAEPDVVLIEGEGDPKAAAEDAAIEDVLWTEKYQPHNSSELIGNSAAIRRLHSWLREWKIRAEKEEKILKSGKDKDDTWGASDFHDSEDSDEDGLCNTLLISGPPGVGKTAAVYACAQELGFKVFEVNSSCQRSGRQILAQLKEATQSHQVDQQGVSAHKPSFFSSTRSPRKLLNSPKRVLSSPKRVVSSPRKPPVSPRGPGLKRALAPKSLANFFKAAPKPEVKRTAEPVRAPPSGSHVAISDKKPSRSFSSVSDGSEESHRKTATSLILFEEVDIIFEDDSGFLSAVKTFMSTTKRPVILTTSNPTFRMTFDGTFEEISFRSPSVVNVSSFLQVLCVAENLRMDMADVMTFLSGNRCDIRRSLLHLQFWARSGGGGSLEKPLPPPDKREASDGARRSAEVPACSVGCAENLLGVNSILHPNHCLVSFVRDKILEAVEWDRILRLLSEFHCQNISFTSSNLEFLLPLPVEVLEPTVREVLEPAPEDGLEEEAANVRRSAAMRRQRKLVLLNDSDLFDSDSNSVDEAVGTKNREEERAGGGMRGVRRVLSSAELQASLLVCRCLDSMAEYADHMSSLDCATFDPSDPAFTLTPSWTESRLMDGLCDGPRSEGQDCLGAQNCGDIRGLMEALSFHKCSSTLSAALSSLESYKLSGKDPTEELTLRVSAARAQVNFGEPTATTDLAESRRSVVRDVMSHRAFMGLGNRDANVTDYLPALRTICRLEKGKEEGKTKRRFLHYLEGIHLELGRGTLGRLAADFP